MKRIPQCIEASKKIYKYDTDCNFFAYAIEQNYLDISNIDNEAYLAVDKKPIPDEYKAIIDDKAYSSPQKGTFSLGKIVVLRSDITGVQSNNSYTCSEYHVDMLTYLMPETHRISQNDLSSADTVIKIHYKPLGAGSYTNGKPAYIRHTILDIYNLKSRMYIFSNTFSESPPKSIYDNVDEYGIGGAAGNEEIINFLAKQNFIFKLT